LKIQISYFGHIRTQAGIKTESIELPAGSSLDSLLEIICRKREIREQIFGQSSVNLLVNGRNVKFLGGMDTMLSDGDEVSIFPPTGGG
jgi:molybdopterin synthase sulfur carrier subunit